MSPPYYAACRDLALVVLTFLLAGAVVSSAACSHHDAGFGGTESDAGPVVAPVFDASRPVHPADATLPPDARADEARLAIADAGRSCGTKNLPDCPLQLWMKENATTILGVGEIATLADAFDQIAAFAPPPNGPSYAFANWVSISRDGAAASRMGDLTAAEAACRGCHAQYLQGYHATMRGLPLHPSGRGKR